MADTATPVSTAELMFRCFKRMGRLVDAKLSESGMSLSRSKILSELHRAGPLNQRTLATTFSLAPRTMTELIDILERDGLVERQTDPGDRRARYVHLTPAGDEARIQANTVREQLVEQILGPLSDEQRNVLFSSMQLIHTELDKIDPNGAMPSPFCPGRTPPNQSPS